MMADAKAGFVYTVEHIRDGVVLSREQVHNLVPTAGLNHMVDVTLKNGTQYPGWYIAPYEGNYTPVAGVTMTTLPSDATETTAYSEATRVAFVPGTIANGAVDNLASKAEFTFTAAKTIYGGFVASSSAKSSTTGLAISVVKFTSPKVMDVGDVLRITSGLTLSNI